MVTINDIAKYCNVSGATVSYVLSGKGAEHRISLSTQNQILNAAEELGYTRKQINSSNNLKIAVYFMYKELEMTIPPLIYGISNVISSEVLPIDLIIRPYDLGQLSDYKYLWKNGGCNAAIIVAAGIKDLQFLESNKPSVPVVLLNRDLPGYSSVSIDHEEAGRLTAEHAISVGGSDIAVVLNPSTLYGFNLRSSTIFKICEERGINIKDNLFYGNNQIDTGYEIGWEMVRKNKLHKVIICMYDMVAMGIISALNGSRNIRRKRRTCYSHKFRSFISRRSLYAAYNGSRSKNERHIGAMSETCHSACPADNNGTSKNYRATVYYLSSIIAYGFAF